jgi:hypothetical protein
MNSTMHGSNLVAYLAAVPCPNCGNERAVELHAVYSTARHLLDVSTYHCLSLNCPVCHHGNSWPVASTRIELSEYPGAGYYHVPAMAQINLPLTLQYYRQLGFTRRLRFDWMLNRLGFSELRRSLKAGVRKGTH